MMRFTYFFFLSTCYIKRITSQTSLWIIEVKGLQIMNNEDLLISNHKNIKRTKFLLKMSGRRKKISDKVETPQEIGFRRYLLLQSFLNTSSMSYISRDIMWSPKLYRNRRDLTSHPSFLR